MAKRRDTNDPCTIDQKVTKVTYQHLNGLTNPTSTSDFIDLSRGLHDSISQHSGEYQSGPCNAKKGKNFKFTQPANTFKSRPTVAGEVDSRSTGLLAVSTSRVSKRRATNNLLNDRRVTNQLVETIHPTSTSESADQCDREEISNDISRGLLTSSVTYLILICLIDRLFVLLGQMLSFNKTEKEQQNAEYQSGPCNAKKCENCKFMKPTNTFKSTVTGISFSIKHKITCKSENVVYLMQCKKCKKQYVGETERALGERMNDHRSRMKKPKTLIARHFSAENHSIENLEIIGIEIAEIPLLGAKFMTGGQYSKPFRIFCEKLWQMILQTINPDGLSVQ